MPVIGVPEVSAGTTPIAAGLRNFYAPLDELKALLDIALTTTTYDATLARLLEAACREVDGPECAGRSFFVETGVRYFDAPREVVQVTSPVLLVDDLLTVTGFATDEDGSRAYATVWTEGTDYDLEPHNEWPKTAVQIGPWSTKTWPGYARGIRITGTWGYGDGAGPSPWSAAGITATVATTAGTTLTLSAGGVVKAGHTILVDTEQMFVRSVTESGTVTAVVERGVNGTTAASQNAKVVSLARYPSDVVRAALYLACEAWNLTSRAGVTSEGIGAWRQTLKEVDERQRARLVARVRKAF